MLETSNLPEDQSEPELSLLDILLALGQEKLTFIGVTLIAITIGVALALLMTPVFSARSVIMPAQQGGASSAALASLGALSSLAGLGGLSAGIKSSDEMYIAFMRSQTVLSALVQKLNLKQRYETESMKSTLEQLNANLTISADKKAGLISIVADDREPEFAARLANATVQELNLFLSRMAVTEAQQRRAFYEQQLDKTQKTLAQVDARFRQAQEKSGLQITSLLAEAGIRSGAEIRAQIVSREIQLQSLSRFATAQNPDMQRLSSELSALRAQLLKYEQGTGENRTATPIQQEAQQAYRDLKVQEAKLEAFVRQLEAAKMDEAKEGPPVQVVDLAVPPEMRSKPERGKIVTIFALGGAVLGLLLALFKAYLRRVSASTESRERWSALKQSWSFK